MVLYAIIGITLFFSYQGFQNRSFFEKYLFQPEAILRHKEWYRMISSGFLHVDWIHFGFNMYVLYSFSQALLFGGKVTEIEFVGLYLLTMIGGNALALFINRHNGTYRAVGASGAVSGVIYASIIINPHGSIGFIFLPGMGIPSWIFGILFILYSIFGIKSKHDNIGHEAHLGGAIAGLIITVAYFYNTIAFDYWIVAALLVPTLIFLYVIVYHPEWLLTGKTKALFKPIMPTKPKKGATDVGLSPDRQRELDRLLEKVKRDGLESLSIGERLRLDELSRKLK